MAQTIAHAWQATDMAPQLTEHHFNPAGRLYSFLEFSTSQGNVVIESVWTSYFEAEPNSPEYFTGLTAVLDLPRQIRRAVEALPPDALKYRSKDKLLRPLPTAQDTLRLGIENPRAGTDALANELATHALFDLEICSDVLRGNWQSDGDLNSATATLESKIKETLELADDLSKALGELPDLDAELRFTLLDAVQRIRRSIDLYRVLGPESLGQARDQLVGSIVMNPTVANRVRQNPSVGKKVAALVVVLGSFVSLFNGTTAALETTTNFVQSIEAPASDALSSDDSSDTPSEPEAPGAP